MSPPRARVGIVGAGWWSGQVHIPSLKANPRAELVGVCDADTDRAKAAAARFEIPHAVGSVAQLLDLGVDCVIVATPHDAHHAPAAAALDAGVHVLVEKPMTMEPAEAWDLVERARRSGVSLQVGYPVPHSRHAARLRRMLGDGDLGRVVLVTAQFASSVLALYVGDSERVRHVTGAPFAARPSTYADPARGGGQLYTQMTHAAALVLWATDLQAREVTAFATSVDTEVDVADAMSIRMTDGSVATLASTGTLHDGRLRMEEYRIFGTTGHAVLEAARGTLDLELASGHVDVPALAAGEVDMSARTSAALVATAVGQAPAVVTGELGARVVDLLHAAHESIRAGGRPTPVPDRTETAKEAAT